MSVSPADWEGTTVGAEFEVQLGKMLDAARNTGVLKPYLGNRAVQWGRIDLAAAASVPMTPRDIQRFRLRRGDLLVCEGGEVGRAAIWWQDLECYYQKALHRLRSRRGYDSRILLALLELRARGEGFADYVTQTSIAHLSREKLIELPIPAIPSGEQREIARALDDADELIRLLERLVAKKRGIKQGMMQELLSGSTRLQSFDAPWPEKTVGDVAAVKTGPFGSALHEEDYVSSGTPIITVEHLGEFGVRGDGAPMVSETDRWRLRAYTLVEGDVVFSRVGSIDRNVRIGSRETGWLFSGRLLRVRFDTGLADALFMSYQLRTERFLDRVRSVAVGQTMPSLNTKILSGLPIKLPTLAEQRAIATVLVDVDAEITALERRLVSARAIKTGMMQELLTGSTRLPMEAAS